MAKKYRIQYTPTGDFFEGWRRSVVGPQPVYRTDRQAQYLNSAQLKYYVTDLINRKQSAILDQCKIVTYDLVPTGGGMKLETYRRKLEAEIIVNKLKA